MLNKRNYSKGVEWVIRSFWALIVLLVALSSSAFADGGKRENFLPVIDDQLEETIGYIFHENYQVADSLCQSMIRDYPEQPAGYFMKAILHWKRGYFKRNYNKYNDITLKWLKETISVAKDKIRQNPNDASAYFFAGGAYGYQGSVYARRKSWFKTGRAAYNGIQYLEKSMKIDSTLYDVYYGSGMYHVLASHQSGIIKLIQRLLPIPKGDSEVGLNHLKIAMNKGKFTSVAAKAALALAYVYYEGKYQKAIDLLTPLIEKYPNNVDFLTNIINAYFYRELTQHTNQWQPLLDVINHTRHVIRTEKDSFQKWWLDKFTFIEGYAYYKKGDLPTAQRLLQAYCRQYSDKGDSYLTALGYLTLGKIADLQDRRTDAINLYKKVSKFEQIGNEKALAKVYMDRPFKGESLSQHYTGSYVDLPDRP